MTCSEPTPRGCPAIPGSGRRLIGRALVVALVALPGVTAVAAAPPIQSDFSNRAVLVELPETRPLPEPPASNQGLAERVRYHLRQAQQLGDPRQLGYAQRLLVAWPGPTFNAELRLLRARLNQSLHEFDAARADLAHVQAHSQRPGERYEATLLLATLALAQGHYLEAGEACQTLIQLRADLLAHSCQALATGRSGRPAQAYHTLRQALRQARTSEAHQLAWALGSLAELADQLALETAGSHWQSALLLTPDDLYLRSQLVDWHLRRGQPGAALALTEGYIQVDGLAVLRAVALGQTGHDQQAVALTQRLAQRFSEALWRGNLLHRREYARYLLDVVQQPEQALTQARLNWQQQREPADTRLLLRAAQATGDSSVSRQVGRWRDSQGSHQSRDPAPGPNGG
ncbi:hypothetical protein [Marinobacter sp. SS21]|uniref:hypothetical protein n=1 Tax=Marinobacter sp. SS21 TaxID=2979460 RepID=UPI00232C9419|nr:hypothetical protein [Marinobacter sp. SS21]MDC0661138.1 hypothetical protein [Marinobacter sp. SS21]